MLIAAVIAAYTWINLRGVREAATVSTAFTIAKLIPLLAFVGAGLFLLDLGAPLPETLPAATDVATAVLLMTFAFFGFDATTIVAGEVRDARRSIPFAIFVSVGSVATLYALIQLVCVAAVADLAASERPLADAAASFFGPAGALTISIGAVVSCMGIVAVLLTTATRALFAMGEGGQLPAVLATIHPRFRTPHWAIATTSVAVLMLALSGTFIYLVKLTLIARVLVFAATCATVPLMRRRPELPAATFKVPAGSLVGWICVALCLLFLARSSMREMLDVAVAAAAGLVIFGVTRLTRAPAPT
jgi:amino acid transporter